MDQRVKHVLIELHARLAQIYGDRLRGVYAFGSFARGEADAESDLDVLIVLDRVDDYSDEIERTSVAISELSLKCGISLSRVFASEQRWREEQTPFLANARRDAIRV